MPTVPQYTNTQVADQARPSAQANVNSSLDAFGGGQSAANIAGGVKAVATGAQEIAERAYIAANTAAKTNNKNALDLYQTNGVYGHTDDDGKFQPGIIQRLNGAGQNAHAVADEYFKAYDDYVGKYSGSLPNDEQRADFMNQAADTRRDMNKTIQTHLYAEQEKFEKGTFESAVDNAVNLGSKQFSDAGAVMKQKDSIMSTIQQYGELHGQSPEQIKNLQELRTSQLYQGVVQEYFANGQDVKGKQYYNQIRDQVMDKGTAIQLDKLVQEGSMKADSQRLANSITNKYTDLSASMAAVEEIPDPDLRDAVRPRVSTQMHLKLKETKVSQDNNFLTALESARKGGSYDSIPLALAGSLPPAQERAIRKSIDNENGAIPIKNNIAAFNEYSHMSPAEMAKLSEVDIATTVRTQLDDYHFKIITDQWKNSHVGIGGNPEALAKANQFTEGNKTIKDAIGMAGVSGIQPTDSMAAINKNPKKKEAYQEISSAIQTEVNTQQQLKGKPLTPEETKAIATKITTQKVFTMDPGAFWGTNESDPKVLAQIKSTDKDVRVRFNDIPANVRDDLYRQGVLAGGISSTLTKKKAFENYKSQFERAAGVAVTGGGADKVREIFGSE